MIKNLFIVLFLFYSIPFIISQNINLSEEYSLDEFQNGVRSFHNSEYERAITYFFKSLGFDKNNFLAKYFLGESYRKAGYEKNAIFTWNNLLSNGYEERSLRNKLAYLYNKRGNLSEININKNLLLREDLRGYYDDSDTIPIFLKPSQISVDKNNHYYIASFLTGLVVEMDSNLKVIRNHFPLPFKLRKPFGVVVDDEGYLYVSDFENDVIVVFDRKGMLINKIGYKGIGKGAFLGPQYLLFDDNEDLYVVDSGNRRINKYRKNGDILFSFGGGENKDINLIHPAGMFYYNDKIYVCDKGNNKVIVFDKSGNYISTFGEGKLKKPYDITRDKFGRFLILCEKKMWGYEEDNALWYVIDAMGNRLERGISLVLDKENNILVTDYNTSRLFVFSNERERYTNLNVNIEKIFSQNFPDVHVVLNVEKDDFMVPKGITAGNVTVFENSKIVNVIGETYTQLRDDNTDILIIYDKNEGMKKYSKDFNLIADRWLRNKKKNTSVGFISINKSEAILEEDFNSTRLSVLESINNKESASYTDKGAAIKYGIYHMLKRFSKKAIVLVTNSLETGRDFERFELENCLALARNNNIPIYIVSFLDGQLSPVYSYLAEKTNGDYYRAYRTKDLQYLFKRIEETQSKEIVISYNSVSTSRFSKEPISVEVEVNYVGMTGIAKSIYYPAKIK